MPSEEKYMKLFSEGSKLVDGLIQLDGQETNQLGFFQKRKLEKAKGFFELAANEDPENGAPYLMLAKIEERLGNYEEYLSNIHKAWQLEPGNLILVIELSSAYGLLNKHQEAISVLLEGQKYFPDEPRMLFNLGLSFLLTERPDNAFEIFKKLSEIEPDYEMNHILLAYSKDVLEGKKPNPKGHDDIAKSI